MSAKITLYIATSLDGFIAKRDGSVKWLDEFNESGEDYDYKEFIGSIKTVVMGNATYKQILGFGKFPYKNQKCFVFTNHDKKKDKNVTFVNGDVKKFVNGLDKKEEHRIWLVGGADLTNQFLKHDLIDEIIIFIMPIILGSGIRLFDENNNKKELELEKTKTYKSGVVRLNYNTGSTSP